MPLFRGATAVRSAVITYLSNTVPAMVAKARTDWTLTAAQLPVPVGYDAYEPYALDQWPLVGVNVVQSGDFIRLDYDDAMSQRYLSKYTVRVFTWVRTPYGADGNPMQPEYSESIRLRDDLAAVIRACLVKSGSLGQPNAILFDESSLSEEYSEATGVKGDRFVSGVIHSFEIRVDESVPILGIASANTITILSQTVPEP